MIQPGNRIAVAFSGGKDSTALLLILSRLLGSRKDVSLVAITVDEGIAGYREKTVHAAEQTVKTLGIEHHVASFKELFGDNLDTFLQGRETQACTVCGILRRKALVALAQKTGADKIATGHNLNDEAQSVLMNVLRGDLPRLVRDSGVDAPDYFLPRIKPIADISEKEIAAYLFVQNLFPDLPECPYTRHALRQEVRTMLSVLESSNPGTMRNLITSKKKIGQYCAGATLYETLRHCRECGDPCSGEVCQLCLLKQSLGR
jgi:uncharacterized protein (TIGR00269 family)